MIYKNIVLYGLLIFKACTGTSPVEARNLKKGKITNDCDPDNKAKFAVPILNKNPNKMKTCKKLLKKKKTREALCKIDTVQENCPSTCATCEMVIDPSVCEDTTLKFLVHDNAVEIKKPKKRNCAWYLTNGYCDSSDTVKNMCPVSCDTCASQSPSPSPSLSPSLAPSLSPSLLAPSLSPSQAPSLSPSLAPSLSPSQVSSVAGKKFQTTEELRDEAVKFCSNPATYNITKYGNVTDWCVEDIDNMESVFDADYVAQDCNPDVFNWNVSKVTNFRWMFFNQTTFDQDLSSWDVSNGQDFGYMFDGATSFDQDLSSWNVSNGQDFGFMFRWATSFDQDLSSWNVSNGQDFTSMFRYATSFDQDLCPWTTKNSGVGTVTLFCSTCLSSC